MEFLIGACILFTALSTIFAAWSVSVARSARQTQRMPMSRLNECEIAIAELQDRQERTHAFVKKVNARNALAEARAKRHEPDEPDDGDSGTLGMKPGESAAEYKARMRLKLVTGELKHGR